MAGCQPCRSIILSHRHFFRQPGCTACPAGYSIHPQSLSGLFASYCLVTVNACFTVLLFFKTKQTTQYQRCHSEQTATLLILLSPTQSSSVIPTYHSRNLHVIIVCRADLTPGHVKCSCLDFSKR